MRIAIPVAEDMLARHFGHAGEFALFDAADGQVTARERVVPPPHAPGVLPAWLREHEVDVVIAGGMGRRAMGLFAEQGIRVVVGAEAQPVEETVRQFLQGDLVLGGNVCDH